jgi:hypothetical protein
MFLFLSLALAKRFTELRDLARRKRRAPSGRGYLASDRPLVAALGAASGLLAVMVLALYMSSPQVELMYRTPALLWLLCPLLMYWIGRIWLIAHRGRLDADPIVFALKDRVSYGVGMCSVAKILRATRALAF